MRSRFSFDWNRNDRASRKRRASPRSARELQGFRGVDLAELTQAELASLPKSWANAKPYTFVATANMHLGAMILAHAQSLVSQNITWRLGLTAAFLAHARTAARARADITATNAFSTTAEATAMPDLSSALENARQKARAEALEEAAHLLESLGGAVIAKDAADAIRTLNEPAIPRAQVAER
jgi:hypothetical protein